MMRSLGDKKARAIWPAVGALALLLGASLFAMRTRSAPVARLVETLEGVTVNGQKVTVHPGSPLALDAGDVLRVEGKGLARLVYPDGSRFMLLPDGAEAASLQVMPRAQGVTRVLVTLSRGILSFLVPPERRQKDRYELKALNTTTTVEGTSGRIVTSPARDQVALETGKVTVATAGGGTESVGALEELVYSADTRTARKTTYDPTSATERGYYQNDVARKIHDF